MTVLIEGDISVQKKKIRHLPLLTFCYINVAFQVKKEFRKRIRKKYPSHVTCVTITHFKICRLKSDSVIYYTFSRDCYSVAFDIGK